MSDDVNQQSFCFYLQGIYICKKKFTPISCLYLTSRHFMTDLACRVRNIPLLYLFISTERRDLKTLLKKIQRTEIPGVA